MLSFTCRALLSSFRDHEHFYPAKVTESLNCTHNTSKGEVMRSIVPSSRILIFRELDNLCLSNSRMRQLFLKCVSHWAKLSNLTPQGSKSMKLRSLPLPQLISCVSPSLSWIGLYCSRVNSSTLFEVLGHRQVVVNGVGACHPPRASLDAGFDDDADECRDESLVF